MTRLTLLAGACVAFTVSACACTSEPISPTDAGNNISSDASVAPDAGTEITDAGNDAGGLTPDDAGMTPDAGEADSGTVLPQGFPLLAGGMNRDIAKAIARDPEGNLVVVGCFENTITIGTQTFVAMGYKPELNQSDMDILVAKIAPSGEIVWATAMGSGAPDSGLGVVVDKNGNIYVSAYAGFFEGVVQNTRIISKFSKDGVGLWAVAAGAVDGDLLPMDGPAGIALDPDDNLVITGRFVGTTTFGSSVLTSNGGSDIFVAKISPEGQYLSAWGFGGTDQDSGRQVAVDAAGNIYLLALFEGAVSFGNTQFTSQTNPLLSSPSSDVVVAKLSDSGAVVWATAFGGPYGDRGEGLAVDSTGNVYAVGSYFGSATFGATSLTAHGSSAQARDSDLYVVKLSLDGQFQWVLSAGETDNERATGIALDSQGNLQICGFFGVYDAVFGQFTLPNANYDDLFLVSVSPSGEYLSAVGAGGTNVERPLGLALDSADNAYLVGFFRIETAFGGVTYRGTSDKEDIFIARYKKSTGSWE